MTPPENTPDGESSPYSVYRRVPSRGLGESIGVAIKELSIVVVTALILSVVLRTFVFQLFYVPSESMLNTLQVGDKIVASKITMTVRGVERGDVVVFHDPGGWLSAPEPQTGWRAIVTKVLTNVGFLPSNSGEDLVKRVVGVGGDHVKCCSKKGQDRKSTRLNSSHT